MEATTGYLIWRLSTKWRTQVDRVVAPLGLTHAQFSLLGALSGLRRSGHRPSQRELADHLGMEPIYVSKLARALEKTGLVERPADPGDPRAVRLDLTARGHEVVAQAVTRVHALQIEQLDPIGGAAGDRHREFRETLLALLGETSRTHDESEPNVRPRRTFNGREIDIAAAATRAVLDRLLTQAGLSFEEWTTLRAAVLNDAASPTRISADVVFMGPSTQRIEVLVNLKNLEQAGLVRSADDQVGITDDGRAVFERVNAAVQRAGDQLVDGISQHDLDAAKRVLGRISERADEVTVEL